MKSVTPMHLLVTLMVLCLGLMTVEGWMLRRSHRESAKALADLQLKKRERDTLEHQSPSLSPESEAAISADVAATGKTLVAWCSAVQGDDPSLSATPVPGRSIEAIYELTEFIRQLRAKAEQARVGLRPEESFGFAAYAHEGPAKEHMATLHRQRAAIQYLMETLLESRPQMLLAVRRERPGADSVRDHNYRLEDFFEMDRARSLRQPGMIEGDAFRVEFTGQTETLRQFLNNLGTGRQSIVVRGVEVEPFLPDGPSRPPIQKSGSGASNFIVQPGILKFGVILELVRLATNPVAMP